MPVPGVRLAAARTGIKEASRDDLALAVFDEGNSDRGRVYAVRLHCTAGGSC